MELRAQGSFVLTRCCIHTKDNSRGEQYNEILLTVQNARRNGSQLRAQSWQDNEQRTQGEQESEQTSEYAVVEYRTAFVRNMKGWANKMLLMS